MPLPEGNLRKIDAIPEKYRNIFRDYPCFNAVQSAVLDEALETDNSLVISAPTGSGKTAVFEMTIIRHLMLSDNNLMKIIYISPIKALCRERLIDWHKKFSEFGLSCISITGDSDDVDIRSLVQHNLILSTPEKWDVLTRRWRENKQFVGAIRLFLIDEVHLLNADTRGPTLEVVVSRMKTAMTSIALSQEGMNIRFVALSATIPNIEDVAEWIGFNTVSKFYKFSEDFRPVKLNKIVLGYSHDPQAQSVFRFDMSLNYKLPALIIKYSQGNPTLIFSNTRKSVEMTAAHLLCNLQIGLSEEQKAKLQHISEQLPVINKLRQCIVNGIGFHHAGMLPETRSCIEESFRNGLLPVLVTTSTLAMGVNLPAHLVIVKNTKYYTDGGYKDYDEVSIFQMIGRAGRCQFDSSATALILTSSQDREKYTKMLQCTQTIESNLHKHLTEHLNAEVVLRTITDLDEAMRWLTSTFLYVRARKCPEKYKLSASISKNNVDKTLLEMCQRELNKLVHAGMIVMTQSIEVFPTEVGKIMAKYYVAFDTMKLFTEISGNEIFHQVLAIISKCKEFSEIYLRSNDKKCLNLLNKCTHKESNRFPLPGKIKTVDMKINVCVTHRIIQAVLGNLEIHDQSIISDSIKIMRNCERLARCLIEYLKTRKNCYNALLNALILAKCFRVKLWENTPYVAKQLTGVGQVMSTLLKQAGKTTFKEIASTNPRHIEMIVSRKAPFGSVVVDEASGIPEYQLMVNRINSSSEITVQVTLINPERIREKSTVNLDSLMTLLVGDSTNKILLFEKYEHDYILEHVTVARTIVVPESQLESITAHFISEDWVGFDSTYALEFTDQEDHAQAQTSKKCNKRNKQTLVDSYMKQPKKGKNKKKGNKRQDKLTKTANTRRSDSDCWTEDKRIKTTSIITPLSSFEMSDDALIVRDSNGNKEVVCTSSTPINGSQQFEKLSTPAIFKKNGNVTANLDLKDENNVTNNDKIAQFSLQTSQDNAVKKNNVTITTYNIPIEIKDGSPPNNERNVEKKLREITPTSEINDTSFISNGSDNSIFEHIDITSLKNLSSIKPVEKTQAAIILPFENGKSANTAISRECNIEEKFSGTKPDQNHQKTTLSIPKTICNSNGSFKKSDGCTGTSCIDRFQSIIHNTLARKFDKIPFKTQKVAPQITASVSSNSNSVNTDISQECHSGLKNNETTNIFQYSEDIDDCQLENDWSLSQTIEKSQNQIHDQVTPLVNVLNDKVYKNIKSKYEKLAKLYENGNNNQQTCNEKKAENPDSTADNKQRGQTECSPSPQLRSKRPNPFSSPFEELRSKTLKWRSPIIEDSPARKYSPIVDPYRLSSPSVSDKENRRIVNRYNGYGTVVQRLNDSSSELGNNSRHFPVRDQDYGMRTMPPKYIEDVSDFDEGPISHRNKRNAYYRKFSSPDRKMNEQVDSVEPTLAAQAEIDQPYTWKPQPNHVASSFPKNSYHYSTCVPHLPFETQVYPPMMIRPRPYPERFSPYYHPYDPHWSCHSHMETPHSFRRYEPPDFEQSLCKTPSFNSPQYGLNRNVLVPTFATPHPRYHEPSRIFSPPPEPVSPRKLVVSQVFSPTPKPQLEHGYTGYNRQVSKTVSSRKRDMDFRRFEERLNNMIETKPEEDEGIEQTAKFQRSNNCYLSDERYPARSYYR